RLLLGGREQPAGGPAVAKTQRRQRAQLEHLDRLLLRRVALRAGEQRRPFLVARIAGRQVGEIEKDTLRRQKQPTLAALLARLPPPGRDQRIGQLPRGSDLALVGQKPQLEQRCHRAGLVGRQQPLELARGAELAAGLRRLRKLIVQLGEVEAGNVLEARNAEL